MRHSAGPHFHSLVTQHMLPFSHIAIVGCGLIGGSLALALRRAGFAGRITASGGSRGPQIALERGIIDAVEESFSCGEICKADLVYLAAPIGAILDFLRTRGAQLSPGALVTDAGSTKAEICRTARLHLPEGIGFIGGHPMAGSENAGIEYARADLFDRAVYAIAVNPDSDAEQLERMYLLLESIGARALPVDPDQHDRAVALISHLPQLLSTTLAALLGSDVITDIGQRTLAQDLAAGGWRDTTRLAGSSFGVWRDILMTNTSNISSALDNLISELESVKTALDARDLNLLRELFAAANRSVDEQRARRYQSFEKI
ncbi:MAG: prephenate dehydrogenase/arogenate dehydrogenase family protein [Acidobacteria bacterium]|nr:prephenate dehydrogenase/arogenate dehydrogenase family protein [Acidobacteriota bacterium]